GTANGFNEQHEIAERLVLALRAFKSGGFSFRLAMVGLADEFGGSIGTMRGGKSTKAEIRSSAYILRDDEVVPFRRFWNSFDSLMQSKLHYLQVPFKRLGSGGMRTEVEDALVDYVIGLEALLGTVNERTELAYRFRIRGAVLLATKRSQRGDQVRALRRLYDLRSRVVHGQAVSREEFEQSLPIAEHALRVVSGWFFKHWRRASSNEAGVEKIDNELVEVKSEIGGLAGEGQSLRVPGQLAAAAHRK